MQCQDELLWQSIERESGQSIVFGVVADPIPHDPIFLPDSRSTVVETDSSRTDFVFTFQFLELEAGMGCVRLEKTVRTLGIPLDVGREITKEPPELAGRPRLH